MNRSRSRSSHHAAELRVHGLLSDPRGHARPAPAPDFTDRVMALVEEAPSVRGDASKRTKIQIFAAAAALLLAIFVVHAARDTQARPAGQAKIAQRTVSEIGAALTPYDPERVLLREWSALVEDCSGFVAAAARSLPR